VESWRHREAGGGGVHERWEGENREGRRRLLPDGDVGNGKNKARVYEYIWAASRLSGYIGLAQNS
jgi:hypothetical protein